MEFLQGRDLSAVLRMAPNGLPIADVISLATQAAEALAAAHSGRVIHRDLKPANLFVLNNGRLKICDFGIAVAAGATTSMTSRNYAVGSPSYISPERWKGQQADRGSDLYSLGCVIYEMLIGQPPFGTDPQTILIRHLTETAVAPGTLRRDVPAHLNDLVLALLRKDPARRPPSADRVVQLLTSPQPPPSTARSQPAQHLATRPQPDPPPVRPSSTAYVPPPRLIPPANARVAGRRPRAPCPSSGAQDARPYPPHQPSGGCDDRV